MNSGIYGEIINECDRFVKKEVLPRALAADLSADKETACLLWNRSGELDLPILLIPEALGGAGMNRLAGALVIDRLAAGCAGLASVFAHHFSACAAATAAGSSGAEKEALRLSGPADDQYRIFSVCLPSFHEKESLLLSSRDNRMVINGISPLTGNVDLAEAFIVFAVDEENPDDPVAVFLDPAVGGVSIETPLRLPGLKINSFARLTLDNVPVTADDVLATGNLARRMMQTGITAFYGFVAAMSMGCARSVLEKAVDYAGQRYQFTQTIILHQEIQRLLGSMRMKLNTGTAGYLDLLDVEKWRPAFHAPDASLVKAFCTDAALEIVLDAIQIHGGYGYMHEYGLEKVMRDVKVLQVLGETNPYLLVRHIAGKL